MRPLERALNTPINIKDFTPKAINNYENRIEKTEVCCGREIFCRGFFMFIEIDKSDEGKIFSGWMSANEPGDNPLQNADYDLWLVKCE